MRQLEAHPGAPATRALNIALVGNPNTGKSTLFNALTGLRQKTANFPGVTVERRLGNARLGAHQAQIIDLPGLYSLAADALDELITLDALLGNIAGLPAPDVVVIVCDATNLSRNLFLATQVIDLGIPTMVALNMWDTAERRGIRIDTQALADSLGVPVVPVVATRHRGLDELGDAVGKLATLKSGSPTFALEGLSKNDFNTARSSFAALLSDRGISLSPAEQFRVLADEGGALERRLLAQTGASFAAELEAARNTLGGSERLARSEADARFHRLNQALSASVSGPLNRLSRVSESIDRIACHPLAGGLIFVVIMAVLFQAVFAWATPIMDAIDGGVAAFGGWLGGHLPQGALSSLLVDGVIGGVGSVVVFLPQIVILFAGIILLEDSGYMTRAAFMMDRSMRFCGLSGRSFIPMLSSFACAVPGIMATRVIPDRRDRIATILAAPFMTCSARLPVYALLIAAFVPQQSIAGGLLNLQGAVLLGLYLLGVVGGAGTAWLLKRTSLRGPPPTFLLEMPPYRFPDVRGLGIRLLERVKIFLRRAGTIIFTAAVIIWALVYFPRPEAMLEQHEQLQVALESRYDGERLAEEHQALENQFQAELLRQSYLGRIGQSIQPLFAPLDWDWKVSAAVVASFPAREVVIAVLGTIYAVGDDVAEDDPNLTSRIRNATHGDGRPVFNLPMVLGLMVFYAFCLQCVATIAVIRRETASWRWPLFAWFYMTGLGYLGAWATLHISRAAGL